DCNKYHGIYLGGGANPGDVVIQNNRISNVIGWGIQFYDTPCNMIATNNLLFHNGKGGIVVDGSNDPNVCAAGLGNIIISYNLLVNNCIPAQMFCDVRPGYGAIRENSNPTLPNYYDQNLLIGNQADDAITPYPANGNDQVSGTIVPSSIGAV